MRKHLLAFILTLVALPIFAQEATLTVPFTPPAGAKLVIVNLAEDYIDCQCVPITLGYKTTGNVLLTEPRIVLTVGGQEDPLPNAAVLYLTARGVARPNETGSAYRRTQFRTLGFLADNNYITGVTVNP